MSAGLFDGAGVIWQIAELGKVDAGGGGTVAMYMANRNITTLDAGVPVLAMHAPFETVAKLDCYETYKGMEAVYQAENWIGLHEQRPGESRGAVLLRTLPAFC